jgi:hypothetical protein
MNFTFYYKIIIDRIKVVILTKIIYSKKLLTF